MASEKVLYDAQIFDLLAFGGIPRYYTEIIKGISQNKKFEIGFGGVFLKNKEIEQIFRFSTSNNIVNFFNLQRYGRIKALLKRTNQRKTISDLSSGKYAIFHPSFYNTAYLPHLGKTKLIITIYDMIPELYPNKAGYQEMIKNKAAFIKRADQIITISKNTKIDLLKLYPEIDEKIITPIYLGCDFATNSASSQTIKKEKDYFLYVGSREGYKNFEFLIEGLSGILNEELLLYTSGSPFTERENECMEKAGIRKFVHGKFVDDQALAQLYAGAKALIFPSEYEGFGLPIVEAFKNNCPVVLTNCSCFPEIAGDAGIYFENKNKASLISALSKLEDKNYLTHLTKEGFKRLHLFSWENNIIETEKIYTLALK